MGEGCQEHLGEGFSAGFLPAAAPWLALQLPPGSVPDSCGQQKGQEIRMAQAQPQAGLEEINPTPQLALMGSVPSLTNLINLQLPKTNPAGERAAPNHVLS